MKWRWSWTWPGVVALALMATAASGENPTNNFGSLGNIRASSARMPFYKDKELEFYVRSKGLTMRGGQILADSPVIDVVRKGAAVEEVARHSNEEFPIYPLNSKLEDVLAFWADRTYSEGVLHSESATIDQVNRVATGDKKVYLRSPLLDLNGIGFTADFNTRIVTVNSNVEIVLRDDGKHSMGSGLDIVNPAGAPEKKREDGKVGITRAFCDMLTLDLNKNVVILTGNVRVFAPEGSIDADQLELEFEPRQIRQDKIPDAAAKESGKSPEVAPEKSGKSPEAAPEKSDKKPDGAALSTGKLRVGRFIGNVRAVRSLTPAEKAQGEQYATAGLAVYDAQAGTLELTGNRPRLGRGSDYAEAEKIVLLPESRVIKFNGGCRFEYTQSGASGKSTKPTVITTEYADWDYPGNLMHLIGKVRMEDPAQNARMAADKVDIFLRDAVPGERNRFAGGSSGKQPDKVLAQGDVNLERQTPEGLESVRAGRLTYSGKEDRVLLEERPELRRGEDRIQGGVMEYGLGEERLKVDKGSQIYLHSVALNRSGMLPGAAASGAKAAGPPASAPVEIRSRSADLNYSGNRIDFVGNVRAAGGDGMKLACDNLGIDLADAAKTPESRKRGGKDETPMGRKVPVRALCTGKVKVEDNSARLESGSLDIRFGDRVKPGTVEAEKIIAENGVTIRNIPEPAAGAEAKAKPAGLLARRPGNVTTLDARRGELDLVANEADFYDKVKVSEPGSELTCEHLKAIARTTGDVIPDLESYRARDEFPDRIAVGTGRELVRVTADRDVRLKRTLPSGEVQRATGDHAVYEVKERTLVMTADPPHRPTAVTTDSGMVGDKVTIELDTEEVLVDNGDALTRLNDFKFDKK